MSRYANGSTKRYFLPVLHICRENGVDINLGLLFAAREGHEAVVSALLSAGADKNAVRQNGAAPLYIAAENGHEAVVSALLAAGADKNAAMHDGRTPLFAAAEKGHVAVVSALLAAGARTVDWRRAGVYAPFVFVLGFFEERVTLFRHQFQHCRRRTRRTGDDTDVV